MDCSRRQPLTAGVGELGAVQSARDDLAEGGVGEGGGAASVDHPYVNREEWLRG